MLLKMSGYVERVLTKNMASEQELKKQNPLHKEVPKSSRIKILKTENLKKMKLSN